MTKNNRPKVILYVIFSFLFILLVTSFLVEFEVKKSIEPKGLIYNSEGKVIRPPFPSSFEHPLGTDKNGNDLLIKLISGFKYTFLFSIVITFLRMILAYVGSLSILFFLKPIKPYIESFLAPFLYIPAFIMIIRLVGAEAIIIANHGRNFLILYQMMIIVLIGFPPLLTLLMGEFEQLLKKDYVTASRLLGTSKFHLARKQLFPVLKSRFFIVFIQQTISTIILLIHLGVFQIFIGGKASGGIIGEENTDKYLSNSGEWGGMIGQSIFDMVHYSWLLFYPAIALIGLILLLNIMMKQLEKVVDS